MKMPATLLVLTASALPALGGCSDDSGPLWTDGGTHIAQVTELSLPDTIMTSDTLEVTLSAALSHPTGRPEFAILETQRSTHRLEGTVWADVDLWTGSGAMPPTDLTVLRGYVHLELPPFEPGPFAVVLIQPEGDVLADTVHVAAE